MKRGDLLVTIDPDPYAAEVDRAQAQVVAAQARVNYTKSERERVFEKFARGMTEPPVPGHAGLGLYFCKRAVQAHSGEISVVNAAGWPVCFSVWLPTPIGSPT